MAVPENRHVGAGSDDLGERALDLESSQEAILVHSKVADVDADLLARPVTLRVKGQDPVHEAWMVMLVIW